MQYGIPFSLCRLVIAYVLCVTASSFAAEQHASRIKVFARDTVALIAELEGCGYDVLGHSRKEGFVEIVGRRPEQESLRNAGHNIQVVEDRVSPEGELAVPSGYRDYSSLVPALYAIETSYPAIADLIDVGTNYGVGTTYENRHLYAMKISDNVTVDEDEPNIFIVCCHHAREVTTAEYGMWIIDKLTALYGSDSNVTRWVDQNQIYVAPIWNPDGHQYCFDVYNLWRKNRSPHGSDYGVDLNRNYDFNWNGPRGGSTTPGSITYRGPSIASEQETQTCVAFAEDRCFAKSLDLHSYGSEVLYTYYSAGTFPAVLEQWHKDKAGEMSSAFNYGGNRRKPSAEGEHYEWELSKIGAFSFLVETGSSFQPSYAVAQSEFADHIWPGVQWFLDHETPLMGHVTQAGTGAPIQADIGIAGITYTEDEIRQSCARTGSFHGFLPGDNYAITFAATGYIPVTVSANIVTGQSTVLDVELEFDGDSDLLPDRWELAQGLSTNQSSGDDGTYGDPDEDGMHNLAEYLADTHPKNPDSKLAFISVVTTAGGVELEWKGGVAARQSLQRRGDLSSLSEEWTTIHTNVPPTDITNAFVDGSVAHTGLYYRISAERP